MKIKFLLPSPPPALRFIEAWLTHPSVQRIRVRYVVRGKTFTPGRIAVSVRLFQEASQKTQSTIIKFAMNAGATQVVVAND